VNAAVIGSGIAGIATSIRLQVKGYNVEVFEKNSYPGGKLTYFEKDGFRFDAGPSLFTLPHLVDELFSLAGEDPRDHFNYSKKDIACNYFWEDGTKIKAYANPSLFANEVEEQIGLNKGTILDFLARSEKKYRLTSSLFLEKSLHKASTYLSYDTIRAIANLSSLDIFDSLHETNVNYLRHPKAVQIFDRFATYNGSSPYLAPGILSMIPHLEHNIGTYFPQGGMHSITSSLVSLAERLGVNFHYNSSVDAIATEKNRASGVIVDGKKRGFDLVVSNSDVRVTYQKLLSKELPTKIEQSEPSSSAIIFYWGIKKQFQQLDLHNIFFSDDYKQEFEYLFNKRELFDDPTIYINISSKENPVDAPEGCENWFVMVNAPYDSGQDWDTIISRARTQIIEKTSRILNVDISKLIISEDLLEPRTIASKTTSYGGALYGSSSNDRMSAFLRHPNFNTKIKNLYHCGGSVHPGGGIPLCLLSAKIVSDLVA